MSTRRRFLQWAGAGAATLLAADRGLAKDRAPRHESLAKPPAGPSFRLGVHTYSFVQLPLDQALAMTKRLGLKHLSLSAHFPEKGTPDQAAAVAAKVRAAGLDLYGAGVMDMANQAEVDRTFELAKAAKLQVILARPTPAMLPAVNEKVQQYDIRVATHNHGPGDDLYPVPDAAYEKIKGLDRRVGLCLDIGHAVRAGGDPCRAAERFADRLMDVHMKDVSAANAQGSEVEVGRGVIDIPKFLCMLERIRYSGIVSFEFAKDGNDPLPGLAESVGYVRGVLATISRNQSEW
jgi:inosose dehydratase